MLLPGLKRLVSVHPNVFHNVLDEVALAGWQVIQEPSGLRVLLVGLAPSVSAEALHAGLVSALMSAGVVRTRASVSAPGVTGTREAGWLCEVTARSKS